jgi:hypothetical protein
MWFTLKILDGVEAKNIKDALPTLGTGVVGEEAVWCPVMANEVLQGSSHLGLVMHGIDDGFRTVFAHIELGHGATSVTHDAIVVSRGIAEESIGSNVFVPAMDVASWKTRPKMLAERKAFGSTGKLSGRLDGLLDAIDGNPSEVGTKELEIWNTGRNVTLVNVKVVERKGKVSSHERNGNFLATMIDDEINVVG